MILKTTKTMTDDQNYESKEMKRLDMCSAIEAFVRASREYEPDNEAIAYAVIDALLEATDGFIKLSHLD